MHWFYLNKATLVLFCFVFVQISLSTVVLKGLSLWNFVYACQWSGWPMSTFYQRPLDSSYHFSFFLFFLQLRVRREQASSSFAETEIEKGAHRQTKEALDLSEKTVSLKNIKRTKRCRHSDSMTYFRLLWRRLVLRWWVRTFSMLLTTTITTSLWKLKHVTNQSWMWGKGVNAHRLDKCLDTLHHYQYHSLFSLQFHDHRVSWSPAELWRHLSSPFTPSRSVHN